MLPCLDTVSPANEVRRDCHVRLGCMSAGCGDCCEATKYCRHKVACQGAVDRPTVGGHTCREGGHHSNMLSVQHTTRCCLQSLASC